MSKELIVSTDEKSKKFKISKIENGTIIDRIPPRMSEKVIKILDIPEENLVMIGKNFDSDKMKLKDIIKVENYYPSQGEIDKLAVVCRNAEFPITVTFIEKGEKRSKLEVQLPDEIINVIRCINPKCITVMEPHTVLEKVFYTIENQPLAVRCKYCERKIKDEDIELL